MIALAFLVLGVFVIALFKKYIIAVCVCAAGLSVVVSTVYALVTGTVMASSLTGLALLFALFVVGFVVSYNFFEHRAQAKVEALVDSYNSNCDPYALVDGGEALLSQITVPFKEPSAWFLGYFGQALLDIGQLERARQVQTQMQESIYANKKPDDKLGVLVNLVALEDKLEGTDAAMSLIDEGLELANAANSAAGKTKANFLASQKEVLQARIDENPQSSATYNREIMDDARFPMRLRVECAWAFASTQYKLQDANQELRALNFIVENGNKLSLVKAAQKRLANVES
jgi:hypothetical protein